MAVVRVKRSSSEEPLDILLLACKRIKTEESIPETSVFKFAATVINQEDTSLHFSHPYKNDAENIIKREDRRVEEIKKKLRDEHELLSKSSRYKVVNCYRSLNEDDLKSEDDEASCIDKKSLTVLDVESHESKDNSHSNKVKHSKSDYVYDLYYTTDGVDLNDLQLEHVQSVHPVDQQFVCDAYRGILEMDDDLDDEDDSNDENNWRNDYPDEDDLSSDDDGAYGGQNDDEDGRRLAERLSGFTIRDEDDDLSSDDGEIIYNGNLSPSDIDNFGESYAKYKARLNQNEYDSSCSVNSYDSS